MSLVLALVLAAQTTEVQEVQPLVVKAVTITAQGKDYPVHMSATECYRIRRDVPFTVTLDIRLAKGAKNPCPTPQSGCVATTEFVLKFPNGSFQLSDKWDGGQLAFEPGYTFSFATGTVTIPADVTKFGPASMEWRFTKNGQEFFAYIVRLEFAAAPR